MPIKEIPEMISYLKELFQNHYRDCSVCLMYLFHRETFYADAYVLKLQECGTSQYAGGDVMLLMNARKRPFSEL